MAAQIIDGKAISAKVRDELAAIVADRTRRGYRPPGLAVVLVGADPASQVYVRNKRTACDKTGIRSFSYDLSESVTQEELLSLVDQLNADDEVDGCIEVDAAAAAADALARSATGPAPVITTRSAVAPAGAWLA